MSNATKTQLDELERLMSRMPRELCCTTLLPEFGVRWRDMAKAIRSARMSMTSASIARIVCRKVARNLSAISIDDIIAKLRLQMVAIQSRVWHVINLRDQVGEQWEPDELPERLVEALTAARIGKNKNPEVQTILIGDLVFVGVQLKSDVRCSAPLYLATPLGLPVALVSSVKAGILPACVLGLGYKTFSDANLNGRHIPSLLRVHGGWDENVGHMIEIPKYDPVPIITKTGIDYTNKVYDEQYVDTILGPEPPLLTDLHITSAKMFFNQKIDDRLITIKAHLTSQNIAKTLKTLVNKGALRPTSELLHVLNTAKSNRLENFTESD